MTTLATLLSGTLYYYAREYVYGSDSWQIQAIVNNYDAVDAVIDRGNLKLSTYTYLCEALCVPGNLAMLEYIHRRTGCCLSLEAFYRALDCNNCNNDEQPEHMDCLQYLFDNAPTVVANDGVCISNYAAGLDNLQLLQYVYERGCPFTEETILDTCNGDDLECMKFVHSKGVPLTIHATAEAARYGSLMHLQYLLENGCPWDERVCQFAVNSDVKVLQYAIEHGAPYDPEDLWDYAVTVPGIKYIHEQGLTVTELMVYQTLIRILTDKQSWCTYTANDMFTYLTSFGYWEPTLELTDFTPKSVNVKMSECRWGWAW